MAEGRNRRIAAWAFVVAMAFGCGEAAALEATSPTSSPLETSPLSASPALPSIALPSLLPSDPAPLPLPPEEAPATSVPASPTSSPPAQTSPPVQASRVVDRSAAGRSDGNADKAIANPGQTASASPSQARRKPERARGSRSRRAKRDSLPAFERSRFGQLGELVEAGSPSQIFTDFSGGTSTSGMSWAVPLLAIMLPIGLCGFLQAGRRPAK